MYIRVCQHFRPDRISRMRILITFALLTICLTASAQTILPKRKSLGWGDTLFTKKNQDVFTKKELGRFELRSRYSSQFYVLKADEKFQKSDSSKGVLIENSLPKGGGRYIDPTGKSFGYIICWTRIINETDTRLELSLTIPADSLLTDPSPDYLKFFLPPDTMTLTKEIMFDYGVTDLKSFLDKAFHKPTMLQKTINPQEEYFFYTVVLSYRAHLQPGVIQKDSHPTVGGSARGGFILKEHDLFYTINLVPKLNSLSVPWGHLIVKK